MGLLAQFARGAITGYRVGRYSGLPNTGVWFYRIGTTLFDCGSPNQAKHVMRAAAEAGVTKVLVSHHHEDHAGNADVLHRELQATVLASSAAASLMRAGYTIEYYRKMVWGTMPAAPGTEAFSDEDYRLGIEVDGADGWRAFPVHTPGHCEDHHVIHVPDAGALFGADIFVTARPQMARFDQDPVQEMASLRRILALDFDTLYCGHRGEVRGGREALQTRLASLEEVEHRVHSLLDAGERDVGTIRRAALGRRSGMEYFTALDFSRDHMVTRFMNSYKG